MASSCRGLGASRGVSKLKPQESLSRQTLSHFLSSTGPCGEMVSYGCW